MQLSWLMAIAILLPVISAILIYLIRQYHIRGFIVVLTAIILSINSLFFLKQGPFEFTPEGFEWNKIIMYLDFAILVYCVYVGVSLRNWLVLIFSLVQLFPLAYWEFGMEAHTVVKPAFVVDHLSIIMVMIISIIGSLICVYAIKYIKDHEDHSNIKSSRQSRFLFWMVIFLGAMNGIVCSNNLYWLYFFWEVTTLCSFLLIGHDLTKEALNNGAKALWMNSIGGTAFLFALIYLSLYGSGGEVALSLQNLIKGNLPQTIALLPLVLLCFTGFTKAAQFPFQGWLLGAMVAPTPVSALLHSSTMVKAGVYLIVRLAPMFSGAYLGTIGVFVGELVALFGALTFFGASFLAISQTTGKRVLAYSTIANLGLIIACAGINTPLSIAAAILLIIFHAVSKALLFLCAGTIEHIIWSREIDDMEALAEKAPITTLITSLGMISMFLPPFGMLLAKWMALEASASVSHALKSGNALSSVLLIIPFIIIVLLYVMGSAATIVFWGKWLGKLLQVLPRTERKRETLSSGYSVPLWLLLIGVFVLAIGIAPVYTTFLKYVVSDISNFSMVFPEGGSLWLENAGTSASSVSMPMGFYPVLGLFILLIAALFVPMLMINVKQKELRQIYLCGDQTGGTDTEVYYSAGDQKTQLSLGGYYLQKIFGEEPLNPWVNSIAVVLIFMQFGVVMGVILK